MAGERSDLGKIFITDGGIYDANTTYEKLTMVSYNNSTYITLRTVTGVTPSNDRINYGLMAQGFTATYLSSVTAEDVQGLVVEAGSETPAQSLINAIADRVANQLVSNSDLQDILSDYILKSAIANNLSITEEGKVLDARQGKALNDALTTVNTKVTNRLKGYTIGSGTLNTTYWDESTLRYYIIDNLCFVWIAGHLKPISGYGETAIGSGFPKSIGSNFTISCVIDNAGKVPGIFSVNALGQLSITTRDPITATSTTITGRLVYVLQDNYAP